jgi:hypothetical protein
LEAVGDRGLTKLTSMYVAPCGLSSRALQQDIVLANACPATSDPVACASVHSGLLTKGLFASVESFAHLYEELVQTRGVANGSFSVVQVSEMA